MSDDPTATEETDRARERLDFLSAASAQLMETLDYETMLRNVAWLAVPRIADWCAVYLVLDSGRVEAVEVAHRDPARLAMARRVVRRFPVDLDSPSGVGRVVRTGQTDFVALIPDDPASESVSEPPRFDDTRGFGLRSTITAPLTARGVVHGAITLANSRTGRTFTRDDVAMVSELAGRAALAIENARLYRQAQEARARAEASEARTALLASFSETLAGSLELDETLGAALSQLLPSFGRWAVVDLDSNGVVTRASAAHVDPGVSQALATLQTASPRPTEDVACARSPLGRAGLEMLGGQGASALLSDCVDGSVLVLPLKAHQKRQGRLVVGRGADMPPFSEAELALGRQLASRMAIALDNAHLYRQATDAIRVRDNLLSIASHELKTPLTSITLSIDLLRRLAQKAPDAALRAEVARRAESTWKQMEWLSSLVDELLDVTRINAGKLELRRESFDLGALVTDVVERFEHEFDQAACRVTVEVTGDVTGSWDRARVEQVIVNLLTNAAKYGAGKPVDVTVVREDGVELRVRDRGIGVAGDEQERVFSAFERTSAARDFAGLGLGLYITRHIVEAHGGSITCQSDGPGMGATFCVRLP